jgi:hypothetical protein
MSVADVNSPVDYLCVLPPSALAALESLSHAVWTAVELGAPVVRIPPLGARTHEIRIRGTADVRIGVVAVDLVPKLEVFRLYVSAGCEADRPTPAFPPPRYEDSGELMSAFVGNSHQLFVAARRYAAPEWAAASIKSITVENMLVVRHTSGQRAFIVPDDENPGTVLVIRDLDHLSGDDAEIAYCRAV